MFFPKNNNRLAIFFNLKGIALDLFCFFFPILLASQS